MGLDTGGSTNTTEERLSRVDVSWHRYAACRGLDAEIFYPASEEQALVAKEVCDLCPVQTDCLEYALVVREKDGVWGGATEAERRRIIRRRRRAAARMRSLQSA
jgi:WhiB family redox-sensing transcriptional regulator